MMWRAYPAYKNSNIEFIGDMPAQWEIKPIKYSTYVKGRIGWQGLSSDEFIDEGPYLVTGTNFEQGRINWNSCYHVSEHRYEQDPYIQLKENDLLITKDGTIGKTAIVTGLLGKACLNSGLFVTRPLTDDYITEYLYWVLNSAIFTSFINYHTKTGTTISHLYQYIFVNFYFPIPSLEEQHNIVAFLNKWTKRIDNLICDKKRHVELLQEKRGALIHHYVTKGLDPNVSMKHSDIKWLGLLPRHWIVTKFRRISKLQQGLQIAQVNRYEENGPNRYEYITIKSIHDKNNSNKEYIENPSKRVICLPDDILLARTGATGEVISGQHGVFHNNFFKINYDRTKVDKKYLIYYLSSSLVKDHLLLVAGTTTVPDLDHGEFLDTPIFLPTLSEQRVIADFLDKKTIGLDNLITKIQNSIDKLLEYRDALISVTVAGKIDVRKEVA